jgi:hypothetical protein
MKSQVKFEIFRSIINSWENLFEQAANFASSLGREKFINISHSCDSNDAVVTVWYWAERKETNILGIREPE